MALWDWTRGDPLWSFVIDTDSYSGNFEREMSGYVVGRYDEYGEHRGGPYKKMYDEAFRGTDPFEDLVDYRVDDHGDDQINRAPMALAPTPGYSNDGMGNVVKLEPGQTAEHPAYQSVALFLTRRPTPDELQTLARRAHEFSRLPPLREWDHRPKVLGCRLVSETVSLTMEPVRLSP